MNERPANEESSMTQDNANTPPAEAERASRPTGMTGTAEGIRPNRAARRAGRRIAERIVRRRAADQAAIRARVTDNNTRGADRPAEDVLPFVMIGEPHAMRTVLARFEAGESVEELAGDLPPGIHRFQRRDSAEGNALVEFERATGFRIRNGGGNVDAVFRQWGGRLPPLSVVLLLYMANKSLDEDRRRAKDDDSSTWPWFTGGYKRLAVEALNRGTTKADLAAVKRAMRPLLAEKIVVTDRKAAQRDDDPTARYRLNIHSDGTVAHSEGTESVPRSATRVGKRVNEVRNPSQRGTDSVSTRDGIRTSNEEEEDRGGEERATARPAPTSRYCQTHPNGTTKKCGHCRDSRVAYEAAEADRATAERARRAEADRAHFEAIRSQAPTTPASEATRREALAKIGATINKQREAGA